ncbi:PREDICTED: protein AKNAD1 [Galeopterus variegatus]|uniref:Protein AKNAD1 n=1 Tax=Galeopterus variegatus TaxID=482537 RepID=A0ABM0Q815_GALVR|nr:PREDICTED: protein AKNAD1 [Galeopterus variegatus]
MDEADSSEDTTCKQQEDLPYDGDLSQIKICSDYTFTSKTDILDISNQIILTGDDPQEKAACNQTCRNTARALTLDKNTENAVNKKHDKKKQCPATLHIPANKGDPSKSNISDILLHHLSEEQFLRGQGIDCETLPGDSNADSFDEAAIMKNIFSCYVKNSWPKEQTPELTDKLNPKRDGENSNKPSCSSITTEENTSDLEEPVAAGSSSHQENSDFLTKIKSASDKQKCCQGQAPQKQQTGKACSGIGFKYGLGQVHYQLPDFSKVAPKVKIPKNNIINKPLIITEQASFSPKLGDKSTFTQNILETMSWSNCVEKQQQEPKKKITEPSQQIQMEPAGHIHEELLTGIEAETSLFKLSSTFQKDPSSSSSYIFQKIFQGKQMCQKLKEQTDQLKTKVQEFSKRIKQDSLCHLQDRRLVLEKLQGHLELLEQEFLATKEEHLTLQQQVHKHESLTVGDFDPERKVEGEIFKLAMLLEDIKEKIDESKYTSAFSLPMSSPFILHDLAFISSSPSNEMPQEHPGRPPWRRGSCGSEVTGAPRAGPQEAPSSEELRELAPQTYLNGQSGNAAAQDQPDQMATRLSSDSREDASGPSGRQARAGTPAPSPSCAFCRRLLERKQKMEKKDHRRINCGRFSIVTQEKALHLDSPLSSDTGRHFCSDSGAGLQSNKYEDCGARIPNRSKEPLKEFHYRYNTPGQNYVNHSERGAFVQHPSVDESKNSSPPCSKPKWICSQSVTSKSFQDEHEPTPGKKNLKAFMTYSSDPATPSPHFHSCKISGSKSLHDFDNIEDTKSEILNSALDHALRTATILKETTDQMIKTIAEDLAKARRWRNRLKY